MIKCDSWKGSQTYWAKKADEKKLGTDKWDEGEGKGN